MERLGCGFVGAGRTIGTPRLHRKSRREVTLTPATARSIACRPPVSITEVEDDSCGRRRYFSARTSRSVVAPHSSRGLVRKDARCSEEKAQAEEATVWKQCS